MTIVIRPSERTGCWLVSVIESNGLRSFHKVPFILASSESEAIDFVLLFELPAFHRSRLKKK